MTIFLNIKDLTNFMGAGSTGFEEKNPSVEKQVVKDRWFEVKVNPDRKCEVGYGE